MTNTIMRVAMLDPGGFSPPYTHALCDALGSSDVTVRLFTTASRMFSFDTDTYTRSDFFYSISNRLSAELPRSRLALKGIEHSWNSIRLIRELDSWNPDIIHFQWFPLPLVDNVLIRRLRTIAPVVHTVHDSNPYLGNPSSSVQFLGGRRVRKNVDHLIAHTAYTQTQLCNSGIEAESVSVVPHGLLHEPPETTSNSCPNHQILFFGSIKPYKGLETLVDAFGKLPLSIRDQTSLHIAGRPQMDLEPLRVLVEQHGVGDQINWSLGHVPTASITSLFTSATLVALPYNQIDHSGVLMTAIAHGVPVVAFAVGGIPETITDGVHGHLVPPQDAEAFANAMARILSDSSHRSQLAAGMRNLRTEVPTWMEIADRTISVYQDI